MNRAGGTTGEASMPGAGDARTARALRGVLASTVAVVVACAAHVAAGGAMPAPALLTAVLVLSWLPGVALIGVAVRLWRQAAVIAVAEAMLHGVLALQHGDVQQHGVGVASSGGRLSHAAMAGTSAVSAMGAGGSTAVGDRAAMNALAATPVSDGAAMPAWMWAAHAAAAAVTVLLWRRGEADVARIIAVAGRALVRLLRVPGAARLTVPVRVPPLVARRLDRAVRTARTAHPHRGPPLAA